MNRKLNLFLFTLLTLISLGVDARLAQASDADDYNFSWLDPEKKIYVLQNRKYRKTGSVHVSVMGGMGLGDTYRKAYQVQPRLGMWFNEEFGIEAFYTGRFNSVNNAYLALAQAIGTGGVEKSPLIREVKSQMGVLFNWAPWYAKINVFNTILYFDWYFSAGVGTMATDIGPKTRADIPSQWTSENLFAVYLGTGHLFHLSDKFMARMDFLGHFYSAKIYGGLAGAPLDESIFSNFSFNLGIGLKL